MANSRNANHNSRVPWVPVVVALVGAIASVAAAWITASYTAKREIASVRVESDVLSSNSNSPDFNNPWAPWVQGLTEQTTYVGVQRQVRFAKAFQNPPRIVTGLKLINVPSLDEVLRGVGYTATDPTEMTHLRQLHVLVWTGYGKPDSFVLYVGVGLPTESAKVLIRQLKGLSVDNEVLAGHRMVGVRLDPRSDKLNPADDLQLKAGEKCR